MALLATFNPGTPCAGGNHINVEVTIGPRAVTIPASRALLNEPFTDDEVEGFARTLVRALARQMQGQGVNAIRNALLAKTVDLTLE